MCLFFLKSFCCFRRFCRFLLLSSFFQGKRKRKASFGKVLSLHAMGIPGAAGAPSTQAQVQVPASLPLAALAGRSWNKPILGKGPLVDFQTVREGRKWRAEGEPDPREG